MAGARKSRVWSEFTGDMVGWDVALNTTGFHHSGLLLDYARAYRGAALKLYKGFRQTDECRDMDMHPIIFLYRHALEVYLKAILSLGNGILLANGQPLKRGNQIFKEHNLKKMLPGVRDIFCLLDCSDIWTPPIFKSFVDVERVVQEFDEIPHDAFRYPVDRTGAGELLREPLFFNALTFAQKTEGLMDLLHTAARRTHEAFEGYQPYMPS